jgi:hypothetical protein
MIFFNPFFFFFLLLDMSLSLAGLELEAALATPGVPEVGCPC